VLAGLVGADTAAAVRRRLASLERLADRFDALVAGLPLLRAFCRAAEHERAVAASGEEVRTATLATLRVALLAGLVLELLAAMGTALVAVRLGLRLDAGQRILPSALAVLMLVPEAYLPVRRLTADFHAGAAGRAVLGRLGHLGSAAAGSAAAQGHECGVLPDRSGRTPRSLHPAAVVVLEGVAVVAGGRVVLEGVELRVDAGERVCLTGESGAGKTTLLRVVAGLVAPSAGRVLLEGRAGLGWVPQQPAVLAATVLDNVALGRAGADERAVRRALEAVQLGPWLAGLPLGLRTPLSGLDAPLSLGERRRLAVARCLAGPVPRLWLLDEPTAGLDRAAARRLVAELGRILDGATAIIATHDPEAMALGQRRVELCQGR
jgi:ABC-type transport system involved in cytochrome bd biosynthesis fused ATPase/permease subunit